MLSLRLPRSLTPQSTSFTIQELSDLNYDPYISPKADIFSLGMLVL